MTYKYDIPNTRLILPGINIINIRQNMKSLEMRIEYENR